MLYRKEALLRSHRAHEPVLCAKGCARGLAARRKTMAQNGEKSTTLTEDDINAGGGKRSRSALETIYAPKTSPAAGAGAAENEEENTDADTISNHVGVGRGRSR